MEDLLANPAVQAGVAPFVLSLMVAAALSRTRLLALAQVAGFLVLAFFAIGLSFETLTSTRKLVLIGIATGVAAVALEWRVGGSRRGQAVLVALLAASSIWMLSRLLAQKEPGHAWLSGALAVAYVGWVVGTTLWVSDDPVRGASAGLMVGLGTGALGVLGASAVLGLVGISAGAAAGATLLVQMLRGQAAPTGRSISLPASAISALAGVLAVTTASLPWFCLLPVLAAPAATRLVPAGVTRVWLRAVLASSAALVPMAVAVLIAWLQIPSS